MWVENMIRRVAAAWVPLMVMGLLTTGAFAYAQTKDAGPTVNTPSPTLTVEQKQAVQILVQRIELAQLRAQAAQAEFERARAEVSALLTSLQKDGYDLDLQTLTYVKKPAPTAPKGPPK